MSGIFPCIYIFLALWNSILDAKVPVLTEYIIVEAYQRLEDWLYILKFYRDECSCLFLSMFIQIHKVRDSRSHSFWFFTIRMK